MLRKHTICLVSCLGQFYPPPFAWPFMQKLRASRARVWFEHKTSGLLHKFGIQWTRCNFGGRRPWFICQCGKRVAKLYDTSSIVACRHCLVQSTSPSAEGKTVANTSGPAELG